MPDNVTKQKIIDTAFMLFQNKEYEKVTVNDICDACGISKTTFYYHLQSKEEIISSFFESVTKGLSTRLLDLLAAENYWEQIMVCFETLIEASAKIGPDLYSQLYIINLREDKGTFDYDEQLTKVAVLLIERAQKEGQIRNQSPALSLYRSAAHMFEGYELWWCIKKGSFDRKKAIRGAMEDIFDVDPSLRSPDSELEDLN